MNSNGLHNAHERHGELKEDNGALEEDRDLLFTVETSGSATDMRGTGCRRSCTRVYSEVGEMVNMTAAKIRGSVGCV